ncbi:hypothetical protein D3C80_1378770 [compost metagenome]
MRVGFKERPEAAQHLFDGLVEFGLGGVALLEASEKIFDRFDHVDIHQIELDLCFFLDFTKKQPHRNRATCRFYEIKWCICISVYML